MSKTTTAAATKKTTTTATTKGAAPSKKSNPHTQRKPRARVYPNRTLFKRWSKNRQPRSTKKYVRNAKRTAATA